MEMFASGAALENVVDYSSNPSAHSITAVLFPVQVFSPGLFILGVPEQMFIRED